MGPKHGTPSIHENIHVGGSTNQREIIHPVLPSVDDRTLEFNSKQENELTYISKSETEKKFELNISNDPEGENAEQENIKNSNIKIKSNSEKQTSLIELED